MRRPAVLFPIALVLGAIILAPGAAARETIKIKACQTISQPGSYELIDDITGPGGGADCLVITAKSPIPSLLNASVVTIDLAGFTISSNPTGGVGIRGENGIAVRNGSIAGFGTAVELGGNSLVEGLRVSGCGSRACSTGISATGIVKGNIASGALDGVGISATGVITGNYVEGARTGFAIGEGSTVIGNATSANFQIGFDVNCPSNLTDNTAVNNSASLVLHGDGCNNTNNVAP